MKTLIIIPSRLSATRLPGKPLLKIGGQSIISHVVKRAKEAKIGEVYVAAEDQEIVDDVKQNGGQAILTKNEHKTGTDRIYEVFQKINSVDIDLVMNLQGDEPLMNIDDIRNLNKKMIESSSNLGTLASKIQDKVQLENPGTSIKILLNAYLNTDCDIRAFYAISNSENFTPIYLPFPGFNNLNDRGEIINQADNDGRSDAYVAPTTNEETLNPDLEFKERSFTMNDLPSFKFYRVKILMTSTNQVYVPRMKDLRVLALA